MKFREITMSSGGGGHFNLLTVRVNWPVVVGLQRGGLQDLRDGQLGQVGVRGRTQSGRCI